MNNAFTHHKRGSISPQRIARIFAACEGRCKGKCGRKLGPSDDYDIDHILALENGGTDDDANLQVICEWCHTIKSGDDHALAGHGRRMATKHTVPRKFRTKRVWP